MGLPEGHPEKDGVLVDMADLVPEVRKRLASKIEGETPKVMSDIADKTAEMVIEKDGTV